MIRIAVIGVTGRMGRAIVRAAEASGEGKVVAGLASASSKSSARTLASSQASRATGVRVTSDLEPRSLDCDVAIDFSNAGPRPRTSRSVASLASQWSIGTTGLPDDARQVIEEASAEIAIHRRAQHQSRCHVADRDGARGREGPAGADFDIEIWKPTTVTRRTRRPGPRSPWAAPRAEGRGQDLGKVGVMARRATVRARTGEIGFSVTRGGDIVGRAHGDVRRAWARS